MKQADKNIIHSIGWIRQPNDRKDLILEEIEKQISRMNLNSKDTNLKSKCLIRSSLKIHLKNGGNYGKQFLDFINSNENQQDDADRAQSTSPVDMITDRQVFTFSNYYIVPIFESSAFYSKHLRNRNILLSIEYQKKRR